MTKSRGILMRGVPAIERFWPKTTRQGDCLIWTASRTRAGYGLFCFGDGTSSTAHRFIWEYVNGPIPADLEIDHLCRNPSCVELTHLRVVSRSENQRAIPLKASCIRGHAFDETN